jgi:outer membrane receptor protein involved in Fe transport
MPFARTALSRLIRPALCVPSLALCGQLAAAEAPGIEVIVVTPVQGQAVARNRLAANVQTASKQDLLNSHAPDLGSFLNRYLGSVSVNDIQNNPFQSDVNFRGFTASPLLGTAQGLSVYLDGVRLNQPFGDVVSWDLIPESALESITLRPGSNPLFGLNTLGGALSLRTKDGNSNPGTSVQAQGGEYGRQALEFEHGGSADGIDWYVTGNRFTEDGWRDDSSTDVRQLLGKVGFHGEDGSLSITAALADNDLYGNGLQEMRMLEANRESVYTKPDITGNRGMLLNLGVTRTLDANWELSGNAWLRKLDTGTFNGDLNDDSLDQSVYQPNAAERTALTAAGYSGFPASGESAANTPFPKWRCIGQALLNDEPGEKCNGIINTTSSDQDHYGFNLQASTAQEFAGMPNQLIIGIGIDESEVSFEQGAELGYLNADRSITPVGAVADGEHAGDVDGEPLDARVDLNANTSTWSLFATDTIELDANTHLTLSGRYNDTEVENRDRINPAGGTGSLDGDHEFHRLNVGLGLTRALAGGMTAYAGLNQGSRAPSAIELGCADPASPCKLPNAMAGDPPLEQVVASTGEIGIRAVGEISWNLGAYRTDSKDDILFVADDTAGFGYFRNFGKTRRQGIEAGVSTAIAGVTIGANYTFIDATYRSEEALGGEGNSSNEEAEAGFPGVDGEIEIGSGDRMPLIPRQMLKLYAEYPVTATLSLHGDVIAVEGSYARGNENNEHEADGTYYLGPGSTSGYAVLNFGADWQAAEQVHVFLQVNNAFDREYASAAQLGSTGFTASGTFQARPFAANSRGERPLVQSTFFAPGAPRTAWLGVRYQFR